VPNQAIDKREVILSRTELKAIDDAVRYINRKSNEGARSLIEIGEYLLQKFFENDPSKVEDRAPRKGISLRKLAEHPDISLSFMSLSNAVRLAVQEHLFSDPKYKALTDSHKIALFQIPDDETKLEYADHVIEHGLSVRGLREMLEDAQYLATRGRPALKGETKAPVRDLYSSYFKPIDKLLKLDFSIDTLPIEELSDDHMEMIVALKGRLDKIVQKWKRLQK